jgi:putative spermidine/putrescine transport system permease protein
MAVFLTGSETMTMPVQIWSSLRYEVTPIVAAVSTVMILTTLLGIAICSKFIGIKKISEM